MESINDNLKEPFEIYEEDSDNEDKARTDNKKRDEIEDEDAEKIFYKKALKPSLEKIFNNTTFFKNIPLLEDE